MGPVANEANEVFCDFYVYLWVRDGTSTQINLDNLVIVINICSHPVAVVQCTFTHKKYTERHKTNNIHNNTKIEECGPCPIFAGFTLEFVLQLRKKHGKTPVRVAEECQLAQ